MTSRKLLLAATLLCLMALGRAALSDVLEGYYPTCWEPWEVEEARAAIAQGKWDEYKKMNCALAGAQAMPVRVIRCAADVTDERMQHFSRPVPRDSSLSARVCEIELFYEDGSSGIHYTFYFNIERSP